MSVERTRKTMDAYLDALLHGRDFGSYFAEDISWLTTETGDEVHGRAAVRDFIRDFHTQIFDAQPEIRNVQVVDGGAFLEADFVGTHTGEFAGIRPTGVRLRVPYAVAYDVRDDEITALRAYLPITAMIERLRAAQPPS